MPVRSQPIALSSVLNALKASGFAGVFLGRQSHPSLITLEHNARRESRLHAQTDVFGACNALHQLGYEAVELGMTILVRRAAAGEQVQPAGDAADPFGNKPGLAKAGTHARRFEDDADALDGSFEEEPSVCASRPRGARRSNAA